MSNLILVCGLPGTGKTTLASTLSKELKTPCLHKDTIKESLYESFGYSSLDDSRKLGTHSIDLLYTLAEEQIKNGVDLIIEAPFYFEEDYQIFRSWEEKYKVVIYSIICQIGPETRHKRLTTRDRHRAHHDADRLISQGKHDNHQSDQVYKNLPGKIIYIQTGQPIPTLIAKLLPLLKK